MEEQKQFIVSGQVVDEIKTVRARELRREMTPEETILWQQLRGGKICGLRFRRQQVIDGFIVDFYCASIGLIIEVDGEIHEKQADYDEERDFALSARGLKILRLKNEEIHARLDEVLLKIEKLSKRERL